MSSKIRPNPAAATRAAFKSPLLTFADTTPTTQPGRTATRTVACQRPYPLVQTTPAHARPVPHDLQHPRRSRLVELRALLRLAI